VLVSTDSKIMRNGVGYLKNLLGHCSYKSSLK
jgi:hypothetical protein